MTAHVADDLGAYVLGALPDEDAERVRAHLAGCVACRAEHEQLAGMPELLDLLDADVERPAAIPRAGMREAVLAGVRREREDAATAAPSRARARRRTWWRGRPAFGLGSAVAGAAAAIAVLAISGALGGGSTDGRMRVSLTAAASAARASAELDDGPGGTRVALRVRGLAPTHAGQAYEVWFVRREGRVSAGTFTVGRDGSADVRLTTAARRSGYVRLGITREPDGLDPARNGPNVLAGRLPS